MNVLDEYSVVKQNDNLKLQYFYRLTEVIYNNLPVYGVQIERKDYKDNTIVGHEEDKIQMVSTRKNKVLDIVKTLLKNQVSPIHLVDILGEYVDLHVYEFESDFLMKV